jgi:hypothetical protein
MSRRGVLLLAWLAALTTAAGAFARPAASPPAGRYGCVIGSDAIYAGDLYILDGSHYRLNKSKVGVYVSKGGRLTFPSGGLHKLVKGRWYRTTERRYEIALTSLKSGFESEYCTQEK